MNPNHYTSLELSQQLKEAGVKQESELYWWIPVIDREYPPPFVAPVPILMNWNVLTDMKHFGDKYKDSYSAFSVAELGEILPMGFKSGRCANDEKMKFCSYPLADDQIQVFYDVNESEVRGQMLLYLIKNGLVKV